MEIDEKMQREGEQPDREPLLNPRVSEAGSGSGRTVAAVYDRQIQVWTDPGGHGRYGCCVEAQSCCALPRMEGATSLRPYWNPRAIASAAPASPDHHPARSEEEHETHRAIIGEGVEVIVVRPLRLVLIALRAVLFEEHVETARAAAPCGMLAENRQGSAPENGPRALAGVVDQGVEARPHGRRRPVERPDRRHSERAHADGAAEATGQGRASGAQGPRRQGQPKRQPAAPADGEIQTEREKRGEAAEENARSDARPGSGGQGAHRRQEQHQQRRQAVGNAEAAARPADELHGLPPPEHDPLVVAKALVTTQRHRHGCQREQRREKHGARRGRTHPVEHHPKHDDHPRPAEPVAPAEPGHRRDEQDVGRAIHDERQQQPAGGMQRRRFTTGAGALQQVDGQQEADEDAR
jgi:hypothetical protein